MGNCRELVRFPKCTESSKLKPEGPHRENGRYPSASWWDISWTAVEASGSSANSVRKSKLDVPWAVVFFKTSGAADHPFLGAASGLSGPWSQQVLFIERLWLEHLTTLTIGMPQTWAVLARTTSDLFGVSFSDLSNRSATGDRTSNWRSEPVARSFGPGIWHPTIWLDSKWTGVSPTTRPLSQWCCSQSERTPQLMSLDMDLPGTPINRTQNLVVQSWQCYDTWLYINKNM